MIFNSFPQSLVGQCAYTFVPELVNVSLTHCSSAAVYILFSSVSNALFLALLFILLIFPKITKPRVVKVPNVSGMTVSKATEKLEKIGITKYFDQITISSEVGSAKPDKKIFEVTCNKLHVKPEECVMIGDKFKVDVAGGNNLGMASIWANRKNENIDYEMQIKNLNEIYKYIAV